jgi:hypothetical protein
MFHVNARVAIHPRDDEPGKYGLVFTVVRKIMFIHYERHVRMAEWFYKSFAPCIEDNQNPGSVSKISKLYSS